MLTDAAAMEELDADDKRLTFHGRVADRDIVQVCYVLCNYLLLLMLLSVDQSID